MHLHTFVPIPRALSKMYILLQENQYFAFPSHIQTLFCFQKCTFSCRKMNIFRFHCICTLSFPTHLRCQKYKFSCRKTMFFAGWRLLSSWTWTAVVLFLDVSWTSLEPNLERLGQLLERLGRLLERLGLLLDVFGAQLGASWAPLGASWTPLGPPNWPPSATWAPLGPPNRPSGVLQTYENLDFPTGKP